MAQPPDTTETFVREVDENLRRDRMRDFFKEYGNWLVVAVGLFLAISGGLIWWNQHQVQKRGEQVEQLAQIYKDIGSGNTAKAAPQLDALADSGSKAVRASRAVCSGRTRAPAKRHQAGGCDLQGDRGRRRHAAAIS